MQNQQLSDVKGKELVAAGHAFAKAIGMDTPLIEIAKMMAELATRLDCALARGDAHKHDVITWEKSMMEAIGEDGTGSVAKAIAELKAQRDALAAENAALKLMLEPKQIPDEIQDLFNDTVKLDGDSDGYHEWSWVDNPDEVIIAVMSAMPKPETPATDAYLNSVRSGVIGDLIDVLDNSGAFTISDAFTVMEDFAAQLRAGEPS